MYLDCAVIFRVSNILVSVEPEAPGPALTQALFWAQQFGATLHAAHVHSPEDDTLPLPSLDQQASDEVRHAVSMHADRTGLAIPSELHSLAVHSLSQADGLLHYAADHAIDLIVAASPPNARSRPILQDSNSPLADLVRRASCPVLIVGFSDAEPTTYRRLLAPIDFSRHAQRGLGHAKSLAALYGASLDVLHVLERPQYLALSPTDMLSLSDAKLPERKALRRAQALFEGAPGPAVNAQFHVAHGDPAHQIAAFAEEHGNDLIVMSSHGSTGQSQHPLGTMTNKTLRHLAIPFLLVKSFGSSLLPAELNGPANTHSFGNSHD